MRLTILCSLICVILCFTGCGQTVPVEHGPIAVPVAAPSGPSQQVEDFLVQSGAAQLKAVVLGYEAKSAATGLEKQQLLKEKEAAQAEADVESKLVAVQSKLDLEHQFTRFYWTAAFLAVIEALLIYEAFQMGSKLVWKLAAVNGVLVGACAAIPSLFDGIIEHEALIRFAFGIGSLATLVYHYRSKLEAEVCKMAKDAEYAAIALEHAVAHIHIPEMVRHECWEVESKLHVAWGKVKSEAESIALKLHLVKAAPSSTVTVTTTPPAPVQIEAKV